MNSEYDYLVKILMVGDSGVGKSCLLLRFSDNQYVDTYISTIGVDFKIRTLQVEGQRIKLQIWDTAGAERFRGITSSYYRGASGVIIAYDMTDYTSFSHVKQWVTEIERFASANVEKVLVATKADLTNQRSIDTITGQQLADSLGMSFYETSSKNNWSIREIFTNLAKAIIKKSKRTDEDIIKLDSRDSSETTPLTKLKRCCC